MSAFRLASLAAGLMTGLALMLVPAGAARAADTVAVVELDLSAPMLEAGTRLALRATEAMRIAGIALAGPVEPRLGSATVHLADPADLARAREVLDEVAHPFRQGSAPARVAPAGADRLVLSLTVDGENRVRGKVLSDTADALDRRLGAGGYGSAPFVRDWGGDRVTLHVPGRIAQDELERVLAHNPSLGIHPVIETAAAPLVAAPGEMALPADTEGAFLRLREDPLVDGADIAEAQAMMQHGQPVVSFRLSPFAARRFARHTRDNIGAGLAIVLDGRVLSVPRIQTEIAGGSGIITGNFTMAEVETLAAMLGRGRLPVPVRLVELRHEGGDPLESLGRTVGLGMGILMILAVLF